MSCRILRASIGQMIPRGPSRPSGPGALRRARSGFFSTAGEGYAFTGGATSAGTGAGPGAGCTGGLVSARGDDDPNNRRAAPTPHFWYLWYACAAASRMFAPRTCASSAAVSVYSLGGHEAGRQ